MLKYILVSFKRERDENPVHLSVPYQTDDHLQELLSILRKDESYDETGCFEILRSKSDLGETINLTDFTHFVRTY